jgi:hypothetical protein
MRRALAIVASAALALTCAACAEGTLSFGDDDDDDTPDTVTVRGDVSDVNPGIAGADIVVFVFTDLLDPGIFRQYSKLRSVAVASDADPMEFRVSQVESGDLTIVFLQDEVADPDGMIDVGDPDDPADDDPFAILDDPDDRLTDVRQGETLEIVEVDIDFNAGTADAEVIRSVREDDEPD